jgi:hypothetical protein
MRRLWAWLWRTEAYGVSEAWLQQHSVSAGRVGWEGPRWRTPKEREGMRG